jgi:alkaline phosphatase
MNGFEDLHSSLDHISTRKDTINYLNTFINKGYKIINTLSELSELESKKIKALGLFSGNSMSAAIERNTEKTGEPSLVDLSAKAIDILDSYRENFFLMIESARIDFEAHDNDAGSVFYAMNELNKILEICYTQYLKNPGRTLLVFTADHETGGLAFTYYAIPEEERIPLTLPNGQVYTRNVSSLTFEEYKKIIKQDLPIFSIFKKAQNSETLFELLNKHLPYEVSYKESEMIFELLKNYKKGK